MEARARSSPQQFLALLEFMETNGDITRPQQALQGRVKSHNLWLDLSYLLNSVGGGVTKTPDRWKKVWVDWKNKTKKKALAIRKHSRGTGGGPKIPLILSDLEQRLLAIIGQMAVEGDEEVEEQGLVFDMPSSASQDSQGIQQYHMDVSLDDHNYYEYIDFPGQSPSPSTGMDLLLPPTPPSPTPPPPPPPPPTPPPSTPPPSTASTSAPLVLRLPRSALTATPPSQPSVRSTSGFGALHATPVRSTSGTNALHAAPVPSTSDTSALHTITARPMPPRSASRPTSARSISARPSSQQQRVPTLCSTPSRQRRQRIRTETPFDRAASEFVAIEQRRIKLDEDRERIETRRVEVEAQRVKAIEDRNAILSRFADIAQAWVNK